MPSIGLGSVLFAVWLARKVAVVLSRLRAPQSMLVLSFIFSAANSISDVFPLSLLSVEGGDGPESFVPQCLLALSASLLK